MSESITFWNHRLEKIQYALRELRSLRSFDDITKSIEKLEELETEAARDLVEAENTDDE